MPIKLATRVLSEVEKFVDELSDEEKEQLTSQMDDLKAQIDNLELKLDSSSEKSIDQRDFYGRKIIKTKQLPIRDAFGRRKKQ